jgi:hypothetical protein
MKTIGVLTSYFLEPITPLESPNIAGLIQGLAEAGLVLNRDFRLVHSYSNDLEAHRHAVTEWLQQGIEVIFSGGSPGARVIRQTLEKHKCSVPIVYYGAHPINGDLEVGLDECLGPQTACVRIELPLTCSHRNFRTLRMLFPEMQTVRIPFACNTVFCHPKMAKRYDVAHAADPNRHWLSGDEVGFEAIGQLCWLIDAGYREHPLRNAELLAKALEEIPSRQRGEPVKEVVIAFNDTFHVPGAVEKLLNFSARSKVPLVWVNNREMARRGAVADYCNSFETVALHASRFVARQLRGEFPLGEGEMVWNHDVTFTLNRRQLRQLDISIDKALQIERYFHQVIS